MLNRIIQNHQRYNTLQPQPVPQLALLLLLATHRLQRLYSQVQILKLQNNEILINYLGLIVFRVATIQ